VRSGASLRDKIVYSLVTDSSVSVRTIVTQCAVVVTLSDDS